MVADLLRHGLEVLEEAGEGVAIGLQDGIVGVDDVEGRRAVETVHDGLDRVAHVVEAVPQAALLGQLLGVGALAVRVPGRRRVGVDDVLHAALGQDGVRIVVYVQERGELLDALAHVAHVDDPAVLVDEPGEEGIHLPEAQRERRLAEEPPDRHPALTLVVVRRLLAAGGRDVHLLTVGPDHGVTVEFLAVVDPRLVEIDVQIVRHGKPADAEIGQARLDGVGRRQGHTEPVRERERAGLPGVLREVAGVQLARPEHHRRQLAVDLVPVDVEHLGELVVVPLALAVLEGLRQDRRIEQGQVLDDVQVPVDLVEGQAAGGVERADPDVVEPHGVAREGDVVLDEHALAGRLGRLHPQALDDERVDPAHDDRHERPQADRQRGQHPALEADVHDEQHEREERDQDEEPVDGQPRVQIGVRGAVHGARRGRRQLVAAQEVVGGLDEGQRPEQHREVRLHLRGDALPLLLEPDPPVHVVRDGRDEERQQDDVEQPVHDVRVEGQLEDVEADVVPEPERVDRVVDAEVHAVGEEEPLLPLVGGAGADRQGEQQRQAEPHETGPLPRRGVIAGQHVLLGTAGPLRRRQPIGDRQVPVQQRGQDGDEDQRQDDPRDDDRAPHVGLGQSVEPEVVGVEAGRAAQRHQHDNDRSDPDEDSPPQATGSDRGRRPARAARRPRS